MAQPVYPTTLPYPERESFVREPAFNPTIQTDIEDGAVLIMRAKTTVPLAWSFVYRYLSATDKETLMAFWEGATYANCGAVVVKFTDPTNSTAYFVHFTAKPTCQLENSQQMRWRVTVNLLQALGTYT